MTSLSLLLWIILGIALQVGLFLGISFWQHWQSYSRLKEGQPEAVESIPAVNLPKEEVAGWSGFRTFKVARRAVEDAAGQICSFYLQPEDRQALPSYQPGQFLTFRLDVPKADGSGTEQITRCYSLSDAPQTDYYRVSIKRVPAPPRSDHPPGRSSNFFHDHIQVGT
ncbi:MAG: FAD/NAD(P)-binding oxidoreductase, partial [Burkholderiaceae bacterium]|nr:FAD/NAD(P)-binding oxidoreductase [Burkholderiaceae bacterium]